MTLLDLLVMSVVLFHVALGLRRGLIRILCDLLALVLGVWAAFEYYVVVDGFLKSMLMIPGPYSTFIAFVGIWGIVYAGFSMVGQLFHKLSKITLIWPVNIFGGGILGGVRGLFYMLPILVPLAYSDLAFYHESRFAGTLDMVLSQDIVNTTAEQSIFSKLKQSKSSDRKVVDQIQKDETLRDIQSILQQSQNGVGRREP